MTRSRALAHTGVVFAALAFAGTVAAQSPTAGPEVGLGTRIAAQFVVLLVLNLLLGGALVAIGTRYATKAVGGLHDDPGGSFAWGLLVEFVGLMAIYTSTSAAARRFVAIPAVVALVVVELVGVAVAVVWVGDLLTGGRRVAGGKAAAVGALALAIPGAVPVLGLLLYGVVATLGLGVVSYGIYESRQN